MNWYEVVFHYPDGTSEAEAANDATVMGYVHKGLSYPSVERFEVIKKDA